MQTIHTRGTPNSTFPEKISAEALRQLPLTRYQGTVHHIQSDTALLAAILELLNETILGFDTESQPAFVKGQHSSLALVQLATASAVYIVQLNKLSSIEPLIPVFSHKGILKVGIALQQDIKQLNKLSHFTANSFIEIPLITQQLGIFNTGMRALAGILLSSRISKSVRVSNWGRKQLTPQQISYAATDAWISRRLYTTAKKLFDQQASTP